jgi:NADH:ubiquinone oxidoreductase subunit 2 (subunit N)
MVLFGIIIFILAIGLLSSQISTINLNRVAIIVLLLSGVLAFHAMWVGQLGSGVGIFNGLFQVTAVTQGIDLFIYIVSALVLLISETQVQKYQLNNEEPAPCEAPTPWVAELAGSSNVEVQSIGFPGVSSLAGLPPRTFKILAEHPLIVLFSVFLFLLEFQEFPLLSNWSTCTQLLLFNSMLSFIVGGGCFATPSQYRVKRLLAYSSISHVGFLILALAVNSVSSVNSLLFYLVLTTFFGNMYNGPLYLFLTLLLHSLHLLATLLFTK